jgi:peptidyl-prolyl cis-trans isomerase A (cyclophilin A)
VIAFIGAVIVAVLTSAGEIDIRVDTVHAPLSAANFLSYVRRGFYDGGAFFRTVTTRPDNQPHNRAKIDVIQATHNVRIHRRLSPPVPFEPTSRTGLRHLNGTVSLARDAAIDTAQTDFFICIGAQPSLDDGGKRSKDHRGFAAFGQVVRGMDVVRAIHGAPQSYQQLTPPFRIIRARVVRTSARVDEGVPAIARAVQRRPQTHTNVCFYRSVAPLPASPPSLVIDKDVAIIAESLDRGFRRRPMGL